MAYTYRRPFDYIPRRKAWIGTKPSAAPPATTVFVQAQVIG